MGLGCPARDRHSFDRELDDSRNNIPSLSTQVNKAHFASKYTFAKLGHITSHSHVSFLHSSSSLPQRMLHVFDPP
ncbi:hypothetical protein BLNAU_3861 [Blattamonas nauphoetae]|uniref:Uncharacterized protein n=1 Tax=Blattamonas nauphoetae TaxID=2049346 RepID=A0ABQ9YBE7_9EUKA|nr:hypothetical protein BLNAU_3861 [Blattamonas nauphoetae]